MIIKSDCCISNRVIVAVVGFPFHISTKYSLVLKMLKIAYVDRTEIILCKI